MSKSLTQQLKELNHKYAMLAEENDKLCDAEEAARSLLIERNALLIEVDDLKKKLASSESAKDMYRSTSVAHNTELEQLHEVLDALPGSIPKRAEGSYNDRSVSTRLAAWLGSTK